LPDLIQACREGNELIEQFDTSCFSGEYITGVKSDYLEHVQQLRSDKAGKEQRQKDVVQAAV